jgi:5'-3' exonuclease
MGVPQFFAWLVKRHPRVIRKHESVKCDALYLDWNGGIHPACRSILSRGGGERGDALEESMISEVLCALRHVFSASRPNTCLYVGVDGTAPRAKMNQQRARRFKSAKDASFVSEMKKKHGQARDGEVPWDTNAITPGTRFMDKLMVAMKQELLTDTYAGVETILSDSSTPMEGEHKIMMHLREHWKEYECVVIYGLDADLIFLSLLSKHPRIYLLRESSTFDVKSRQPFCYLDIERLKDALCSELDPAQARPREEIVKDFVVMCFLLGNDFIPRIPSLHKHNGAIESLIQKYRSRSNGRTGLVTVSGDVDYRTLMTLFPDEARHEGLYFKDYYEKMRRRAWTPGRYPDALSKELDQYDHLWPRGEDRVKFGMKGWKQRYYAYAFGIDDVSTESGHLKRTAVSKAYLAGMAWVWRYYTTGVPSWSWYYGYHHAPLMSDLVRLVERTHISASTLRFQTGAPATELEQLLCVLPPASFHLLPAQLKEVMTRPGFSLEHYYPTEFDEDAIHKDRRWQTIPIIPFVDEAHVRSFIAEVSLGASSSVSKKRLPQQ